MALADYFLKIDGIEGESKDSKFAKAIDVYSYSWGESQAGSAGYGGGGGTGKVSMQDLHFVARMNTASPKLMLACCTGQHIGKAQLFCRKAGGEQQEFLTITLSDLLVSGYQTGGSGGDLIPMDNCSLNFSKIEFEYKMQDEKGVVGSPVKAGWDVKANKKV